EFRPRSQPPSLYGRAPQERFPVRGASSGCLIACLEREERRRGDRRLDRLEGALDNAPPERRVARRPQPWVAADMLDLHAFDDAVAASLKRDCRECADHCRWDPAPLDLFADRCTATI